MVLTRGQREEARRLSASAQGREEESAKERRGALIAGERSGKCGISGFELPGWLAASRLPRRFSGLLARLGMSRDVKLRQAEHGCLLPD